MKIYLKFILNARLIFTKNERVQVYTTRVLCAVKMRNAQQQDINDANKYDHVEKHLLYFF